MKQKIAYKHNNPVKSGFVTASVDWKYGNPRNYEVDQTILKIEVWKN